MVATRKTNRPKAVVTTISKEDAFAIVKGEELNTNRYRRPCHLCGEVVDAEKGVLGGNKTEGWWAAHEGGTCFTPAKKSRKRTVPVVRKTDDFDEMVAAQIAESASKKKTPVKPEPAAMVDEPTVPVRGTGKRISTMAAAKKTVARRTTRKAAPAPTATVAAKRPVKRSAPKKVEPNKPVEVDESASTEEDAPEFTELDKTTKEFLAQVKTLIKNGLFDAVLGELDDAIGERLDAVDAAKPTAKKTAAKKSTTTRATVADKVAPVKRAVKSSASASKPSNEEVEIVKVSKPARGRDYQINPRLKNKMAGLKITFKSYVADSDNKKASVTLREEYNGKPAGTRVTIPTSSIVQDN